MINAVLADGRVLGVEAVSPHEAMRLAEGVRDLSGNRGWWNSAVTVAAVRTINEIPNPFPFSKKQIRALVSDFGDDGLQVIRKALKAADAPPPAEELELAPLTAVEKLDLFELADAYNDVPGWIAPAFIAATVRKIGNDSIPFPQTRDDIKALVKRLGPAGMEKAGEYLQERIEAENARREDVETAAKN